MCSHALRHSFSVQRQHGLRPKQRREEVSKGGKTSGMKGGEPGGPENYTNVRGPEGRVG